MHTTVMDIMVNVLGGSTEAGKQISTSQVKIILILNWGNGIRHGSGPNWSEIFEISGFLVRSKIFKF